MGSHEASTEGRRVTSLAGSATVTVSAVDGTPLAVHVSGPDTAPAVVLLPGVSSSHLTYGWVPSAR